MEKDNISCSQFVLVHGACHGSWCWYKVATQLRSAGHRVATVDLGGSGINPKQLDEIPTLSGYVEPLMEFMAALPSEEKVVLVGHSYGGISISVAAERFPKNVLAAVYVAGFMPAPGFNLLEFNQQDLSLAMLLRRPFPIYRDEKSLKEATLTEENYGSIRRRIYAVSKGDMIITEEIQKEIIENYPPHDVKEISGSDHMVMLSKPQELSSLILQAAIN